MTIQKRYGLQGIFAYLNTNIKSNYARTQLGEKYIQKQVSKRLSDLDQQVTESLEKSVQENIIQTDDTPAESSIKVGKKLEALSEKLNELSNKKYFQGKNSEETNKNIAGARDEVISCLKSNTDKPLNCWDEVQKFRYLVKDI